MAQLNSFSSITAAAEFLGTFGCFFYRQRARLCGWWGSSSAQGTGGRVRAPAPTAYPKVRLIFCRARCPHRAVPGRPRCAAPTAKTDRARWFGKLRRSCGTAFVLNFCTPRAQWPGLNGRRPLRFCAPEIFCPPQGVTPVNGVRGKRSYGPRRSVSGAVVHRPRPRRSFGFFPIAGKETRRPQAAKLPCEKSHPAARCGHRALQKSALLSPPHPPPSGAPSPRGEGFWGRSPPHPSRLRRATFPPGGRLI